MKHKTATFVVIGGGIAAVSCVEQLADMCPDEPILVVTASRLVKTVTNWEKVGHALESFNVQETSGESVFEAFKNVTVVHGLCTGIDSQKMEIYISNGETVNYKKLCLAAGGRPKLLSENPYVVGIRDTESVKDFQSRLKACRRLVVVGNGGIATELIYELQNVYVTWVVKHKSISATFVDAGAAEFFMSNVNARRVEAKPAEGLYMPKKRLKYTHAGGPHEGSSAPGSALGPDWVEDLAIVGAAEERFVTIEYESEIEQIFSPLELKEWREKNSRRTGPDEDENWPVYVLLSNGKVCGCDLVVSATGVVPNSDIFVSDRNQLQVADDRGVLVDDQMRTSVANVYAAGDICTANWSLALHWFQMRLWTQARQMGAYAGRCMAMHFTHPDDHLELDICFEIFTHVTRFFGYKIVLLGLFNGQKLGSNYEALLRVRKGDEYVKLIVDEHHVHGAILIGETDLEETFENLILNQTDISQIKDDLLNPTVDIEDYFD